LIFQKLTKSSLKKIYQNVIEYHHELFRWKLYLAIGLVLTAMLVFNYSLNYKLTVINQLRGTKWHLIAMLCWQGLPYLAICSILYLLNLKRDWLTSTEFWLKLLLGFGLLAINQTDYPYQVLKKYLNGVDLYFVYKCVNWALSTFIIVIPLVALSYWIERDQQLRNYGLNFRKFDARPYFTLLAIGIIIIGIGSFFGDIQAYYPRFMYSRGNEFAQLHHFPAWVATVIYEFCYASDFVSVELFFRGFLIFAFSKWLGGYAVLAMVSSYCVLHFGKPLPEAISSIFGGYLLGIIAYYTRNIWGGVIIHIGIAIAMELFGYWHRIYS
jgi:membrane protease YdiL (CAAX protease family)